MLRHTESRSGMQVVVLPACNLGPCLTLSFNLTFIFRHNKSVVYSVLLSQSTGSFARGGGVEGRRAGGELGCSKICYVLFPSIPKRNPLTYVLVAWLEGRATLKCNVNQDKHSPPMVFRVM
jgi:hypothetical protein